MSAPQKVSRSFYQRSLPIACTAFASKDGKKLFRSAMVNNGLKSFFALIQQFTTQSEPAYCGLSTLVLVLNALSVDPEQNWKGPWRWYHEQMLNCCLDLEDVKQTGITLKDFQCLAHCQGLSIDLTYCDSRSSLTAFRQTAEKACVEADPQDDETSEKPLHALVVSYSRNVLGQTGSGHFSPIAAYDSVSDTVLILDTARFKYGAHWVPLSLVYEAMRPIDPDTGKSRGYSLLSFHPHPRRSVVSSAIEPDPLDGYDLDLVQPLSIIFRSKLTQHASRREYKAFLESLKKELPWDEAVAYWMTSDDESEVTPKSVWDILEPLRIPKEQAARLPIHNIRVLIRDLRQHFSGTKSVPCCSGNDCVKAGCVTDKEALTVIYLASLSDAHRTQLVTEFQSDATKLTRELLLNEANLVATAISFSGGSTY